MSPNPDDPLFCQLINAYQRAGIRSVPVESTYERTILDAHDFDINCEVTGCVRRAVWVGTAACCGAIALGCTPCKNAIQRRIHNMDADFIHHECGQPCTADDFTYTPLPEGNR